MATTVEVNPTSGAEGTSFEFRVTDAPVSGGKGPRPTSDLCTLSLEGPNGTGYGITVNRPNQTVRIDPTVGDDGEVGVWQARLYRWDDFTAPDRDEKILASAVFNVEPVSA